MEAGGAAMALDELFNAEGSLRAFRAVVNIPAAPGRKSWRRRKKTFRVNDYGSRAIGPGPDRLWALPDALEATPSALFSAAEQIDAESNPDS